MTTHDTKYPLLCKWCHSLMDGEERPDRCGGVDACTHREAFEEGVEAGDCLAAGRGGVMTKPDADDLIRYALAVTGACSSHHPDDVIGVMDDVLDHVVQQAKVEERDAAVAKIAAERRRGDLLWGALADFNHWVGHSDDDDAQLAKCRRLVETLGREP